ncbi:MAG: hypothetical protein ACREH9_01770, partial [Pseudomonadota bacterium]
TGFTLYDIIQLYSSIHLNPNLILALYQVNEKLPPAADSLIGWVCFNWRTAFERLLCLHRFRVVPASMRPCRARWRGDRARSGSMERDRGASRDYFRGVE